MANSQYSRFGSYNMVLPKEGPLILPLNADHQTVTDVQFDLGSDIINDVIASIQGMFLDNSANTTAITIAIGRGAFGGSSQKITLPPLSQAYLPILLAKEDGIITSRTTPAAARIIPIYLYNIPIMPIMWKVT